MYIPYMQASSFSEQGPNSIETSVLMMFSGSTSLSNDHDSDSEPSSSSKILREVEMQSNGEGGRVLKPVQRQLKGKRKGILMRIVYTMHVCLFAYESNL